MAAQKELNLGLFNGKETLKDWLELLTSFVSNRILRVKDILNVEGNAKPVVVHSFQQIYHPHASLPSWPSEGCRSRLIFITHGVSRDLIEKTFNAFRQA
ncbi:MAG: GTP-binding protein [Chromatiales bacterium]|jgi:G3E family GTPase